MSFIYMLLFFLAGAIAMGVIRKLRGGTFFPPPGSDGDHHVRDKDGRWWRYDQEANTYEEAFPRTRKTTTSRLSAAESIVAKRRDRPYRSGRCSYWLKVKNPQARAATRVIER